MSLREKILFLLFSVLSLLGILSIGFFLHVIKPSFEEIEINESLADMNRVLHAVENEIHHLRILTNDWSAWDDTNEFIQSKSAEYIDTNLPISTFTINGINILHFYDLGGNLVWGEAHDLETEDLIKIEQFSGNSLPTGHSLLEHDHSSDQIDKSMVSGILMTEHGPLMVVSLPIISSNMKGPGRGVIIMGRFLNDRVIEKLMKQTKIKFTVSAVNKGLSINFFQEILQVSDPEYPGKSYYIDKTNEKKLTVAASFPGLDNDPAISIHVERGRDVFNRSTEVIRYSIISIVVSMMVTLLLLALVLQKIVTGPIYSLTRHILTIGQTNDLLSRAEIKGNDEIGVLAAEFNSMTTRLHKAKQKLQDQSFQMGMAELASGILHNVRNSLLQISATNETIHETIKKIPVNEIAQAQQDLTTEVNEERKIDLISFLNTTIQSMLIFLSNTKEQLEENTPVVDEIEKILKSYEKWAYGSKVIEPVRIENVIEDACQLLEKNLRKSISVTIGQELREVGYVAANRIILIQIFMNVFANAAESIIRFGQEQGEVRINADIEEMSHGNIVHLSICDNGEGMEQDVLEHIFARGFSTKDFDNTGLGLHWCANAMMAINGKMYAESKGVGQGACFHLILHQESSEQNADTLL